MHTTTRDIDVAKDRLVDTLSSARDVAVAAVRDDIAPAVAAAVDAISESGAAKAISGQRRRKRRRWPIVAAIVAIGAGVATFAKSHAGEPKLIDVSGAEDRAQPPAS